MNCRKEREKGESEEKKDTGCVQRQFEIWNPGRTIRK
jgi:hypothetical protein